MIPKVIHYCWFGKSDLPESAKKCINSWKEKCPGYQIKRWDESNFNVDFCQYSRDAYNEKKWAFVSDVARFKILYDHGGVYLDTDVELIKDIDNIVCQGAFLGEELGDPVMIAPGLGMASEAGNPVYKEILEYYCKQSFFKEDGAIDSDTIVARVTRIMKKYGFIGKGSIEQIRGIKIYPPEYFCPKNYYTGELSISNNTYSIHHYTATWHEPEEEKSYNIEKKINRILGVKLGLIIGKPVHQYYRVKYRIREKGSVKGAIRFYISKLSGKIRRN